MQSVFCQASRGGRSKTSLQSWIRSPLKGSALSSYVKNRRMLPLRQAFSVVQQLLYAVREIHNAGFLHLDIQTGNIFIQGSLAPGESILTLIDFGCARALKDGRTDVISDRLVFTTQGFAAPEILLHNDGSLVLTPAADIYSVGCVLLNLLTGKRYDSAELISNKRGKYIDAMKLYRINCPPPPDGEDAAHHCEGAQKRTVREIQYGG